MLSNEGKTIKEFCAIGGNDAWDAFYGRIYLLIRNNGKAWQSIGAAFGLAGGMLSIILGSLLWIAVKFLVSGHIGYFLGLLEIIFFILTLPLLTLGAYCLDILEKRSLLLPVISIPDNIKLRYCVRPQPPHNN